MGSLLHIIERLGGGAAMGLGFGFLLVGLLNAQDMVPEGIENVFTLCMVLAVFQVSNALLPESGIAAVTVAGIVVGNSKTRIKDDLAEFKEELTVMMIGMLFELLAADVRLAEVRALGLSVCPHFKQVISMAGSFQLALAFVMSTTGFFLHEQQLGSVRLRPARFA